MIKVNVRLAISHYNVNVRKDSQQEMNIDLLAYKVLEDTRSKPESKVKALSRWNEGDYSIRQCTILDIAKISEVTKYPICKLITQSRK